MPDLRFEEWLDTVVPDVIALIPVHKIPHVDDVDDDNR
jgi:hypothetical protein